MTIGIYALYWAKPDLIYIGQSQNIERRFKEHISKLNKNLHSNYKVQQIYNECGLPELVLLEESSVENLNNLEIYWTKEFDSINKGLNIIEAGQVGWGVNSNASKYTKWQILKVISLLSKKLDWSIPEISKRVKVPICILQDIQSGRNHTWIGQKYPDRYKVILNRTNRNYLSKFKAKVTSPTGEIISVYSTVDFAEKYFPDKRTKSTIEGLRKLLSGERKSYLGYTLTK